MIVTKITSGLGNQLFQYAVGRNLALLNGTSLYFDLSYYKSTYDTDTVRHFKLDRFHINYSVLNRSPLEYISKGTKLFPNRTFKPFFSLVKEKHFHFDEEVLHSTGFWITLDGFWQSEKYFWENADVIRRELSFKDVDEVNFTQYKQEITGSETPVSMHIRRGDYVTHPDFSKTFGFVGMEYYRQAVALVRERFPSHRFFVFSDDHAWVKDNFDLRENDVFVVNEGQDADLKDLQLMSLCRHNIIANSSFSWWGAWLNPNPDKLVIAPARWYRNKPDWNTKDLVPKGWTRL
ncbi:alpha-1,2-fucosyltransferase [Larkinella soli]|uniref:alpha-1,2-fucosyltransferase n=1 Tax=Larkinella soli TaxID=1770527 RepID=UPI000FFC1132|nr:alpha-1,2-fucosyltransferase [Larkinella soli]